MKAALEMDPREDRPRRGRGGRGEEISLVDSMIRCIFLRSEIQLLFPALPTL